MCRGEWGHLAASMYLLPGNNWLLVKILLILDVNNGQNIHFVILSQVPEFSVKLEKRHIRSENVNFAFYDFMLNFCCLMNFEIRIHSSNF